MKQLILDGASWNTKDDVYDSFFKVVGAPSWHGKNLDALSDSIAGGEINAVEVPYRLIIRNYDLVRTGAKQVAQDFVDLIHDLAARGTPVEIEIQKSH